MKRSLLGVRPEADLHQHGRHVRRHQHAESRLLHAAARARVHRPEPALDHRRELARLAQVLVLRHVELDEAERIVLLDSTSWSRSAPIRFPSARRAARPPSSPRRGNTSRSRAPPPGPVQARFAAFTWIETKTSPCTSFAIRPRSSSAISVSRVRVIVTSMPRARRRRDDDAHERHADRARRPRPHRERAARRPVHLDPRERREPRTGRIRRRARGFETYFLSEAKTEDARRVERMENEVVRFETSASSREGDPLSFIMNDMAQNEHLRESSELAAMIQRQLGTMHPGPSRGVKQAGFRVLVTAFMPAVLVEIGFGTNAEEARFITDPREAERDRAADRRRGVRISRPLRARRRRQRPAAVTDDARRCRRRGHPLPKSCRSRRRHRRLRRRARGRDRLDALGGLVTKAVSLAPRTGAPAPRVAEFDGRDDQRRRAGESRARRACAREHLPWLARICRARASS